MPLAKWITPLSLWTLTELRSTNREEEEEDIKGTKVELLQWKKEEDHETTNLQTVCPQQDHKEHVLNVAKWNTSPGTALGNKGRQI